MIDGIPVVNAKECQHTHLSGRPCGHRVRPGKGFCGLHKDFSADGSTICKECGDMLAVFPIRKELEGNGEF